MKTLLLILCFPLIASAQFQRVPAWQVRASDTGNSGETIVVDGTTVQEILDNLETVTTNLFLRTDYPNMDTDDTDDITGVVQGAFVDGGSVTITNGTATIGFPVAVTNVIKGVATAGGAVSITGADLTVQFPSVVAQEIDVSVGYISGLIPKYVNTTSFSLSPGTVIVGGETKALSATVTKTLSPAAGRAFHYVYVLGTASNVLDAADFVVNTNVPTQETDGSGWYSGADRCIAALRSERGAAELTRFLSVPAGDRGYRMLVYAASGDTSGGSVAIETTIKLNLVADDTLKAMDENLATEASAMVREVVVSFLSADPGSPAATATHGAITTTETGAAAGNSLWTRTLYLHYGLDDTTSTVTIPVSGNTVSLLVGYVTAATDGGDVYLNGWTDVR